jgi:soluble cytochrome b562
MKYRLLSFLLLAAIVATLTPGTRADPAAQPAPAAAGAPAAHKPSKEPETELGKRMEGMAKAVKALRKQVGIPAQNTGSLVLVSVIRNTATMALKLVPAKAADLQGPARDAFIADYQAGMQEFIKAVDVVAADLKANNNAAAIKDFQKLGVLAKQDHKQFRRPEKW